MRVAVVVRGHKLLVIDACLDGRAYAVLPGGGIEPGESAAEAAVRELAEECSLTAPWCGTSSTATTAAARVVRPGRRPRGRAGARRRGGRGALTDDSYRPLWATAGELPLLGLLPEGIADLVAAGLAAARRRGRRRRVAGRRAAVAALPARPVGVPAQRAEPDGLFAPRRLPSYAEATDRVALPRPAGRRAVRLRARCGSATARPRPMGEFFVTRSARGRGSRARSRARCSRRTPARGRSRSRTRTRGPRPSGAACGRHVADVSRADVPVPGKGHLRPTTSGSSGSAARRHWTQRGDLVVACPNAEPSRHARARRQVFRGVFRRQRTRREETGDASMPSAVASAADGLVELGLRGRLVREGRHGERAGPRRPLDASSRRSGRRRAPAASIRPLAGARARVVSAADRKRSRARGS